MASIRSCRKPPGHDTKNCIATQAPAASTTCRVARTAARVARCCAVSQGAIASYRSPWCVVSRRQASPPVMIQLIVSQHTPLARPCAHAFARPSARASRVVAPPGRIAASCYAPQRLLGCIVAPLVAPSCPVSRYNLLYHDLVQKKWAIAQPNSCNPFFFFFFCSRYCKTTTKIYISFFISSVEPNKFIIIYFIYFFPFLHSKTSEKKISSTYIYIYIHLILNYFAQNFSNQ